MKVQSIQSIQSSNFEAKQRFVSTEAKVGINDLISRMRENTKYSGNGYSYTSTIFKAISDAKGKVKFQDGSIYLGNKLPIEFISKGKALLTIGKTELVTKMKQKK